MTSCAAPCATMLARASSRSRRLPSLPPRRRSVLRRSSSRWLPSRPAFDSPPPPERLLSPSPDDRTRSARRGAGTWYSRERTSTMIRTWCATLLAVACLTTQVATQQPTQRQLDSLAAQVRQLRAKVDSLLAAQGRKPSAPAPVGDDLAALRAAASQAAGGGGRDTTQGDTLSQAMGRERNQAQLNPEIGVTGDVRGYATGRGVQRDNFDPREFEVGFQSALDPYSHTKIFISLEGGNVGLEEGYAYWTGLPGHIRLDLGKYRQQFGELNRWHLHAVPETEYPLAITTFLGEDGLSGTGISLYRAFGGLGTHELTAQVNEAPVTRSCSETAAGRPTCCISSTSG